MAKAEEQEADVRRNSRESMLVNDAGRINARKWKCKSNTFLEDICHKNNLDKLLLNNKCISLRSKQKQK